MNHPVKPARVDALAPEPSANGSIVSGGVGSRAEALSGVTWDEFAQLAGTNEKIEKQVHEPPQLSLLVPESNSNTSNRSRVNRQTVTNKSAD